MSAPFPTHYVAVDPSQQRSAIAWVPRSLHISAAVAFVVGPVERIGSFEPLEALARDPEVTIEVLIECPTWGGAGTKEVRSACKAWERHIKKLFPRRNVINRCDPKDWQRSVLPYVENWSTKERAIWLCEKALGLGGVVGTDADLADACCILDYARRTARVRK